MTEPVDPSLSLPAEVPDDIRDFVSCRASTLTLTDGELAWIPVGRLPIPGGKPSLSIQPGGAAATAILKVSLGWLFSVSVRASITGGELAIDTSSLPGSQAMKAGIQAAIRDLNDWFRTNGKQLGPPTIAKGSITLTKVDRQAEPDSAGR